MIKSMSVMAAIQSNLVIDVHVVDVRLLAVLNFVLEK
jgi:hypothetical protein